MNTPAHVLFGMAAFAEPGARVVARRSVLAASAGALAPDLSLYVMAGWSLYVLDIPPQVVFRELYYTDAWQQVFAIDNSFILWGLGLAWALWARRPLVVAFTAAALLHLALDFPLHNDDARMHFWPLTDWKFESPISYWNGAQGGQWVGALEASASCVCAAILWRRLDALWIRAWVVAWLGLEFASAGFWSFIF
ncbi:MAG: cobalamin biosynthesis protein CobQ [Pseudomonadota bacterium]